ncbi:hypothetical protein [Paraburkholderia nodosa]|uniref:hypothetical protein n=1 Tax=Paraburkholderia nodosa TaxID=392320 RepID=UPI000486E08E|nr:hypothetical protein [Paraburkholderia nodosa]
MHWIDPACLAQIRGRVSQFLLNPHGVVDGLILDDRRQVHVPPHLAKQLTRHVAPGDRVRVRGVKPRVADVIAAVLVTSDQGVEILDNGPGREGEEPPKLEPRPMEAAGEVVLTLHGPKGEVRGALLADGTSLRMPAHAAAELADYLCPGIHVQVWGRGVKTKYGCTIDVDEIAELVDSTADPAGTA